MKLYRKRGLTNMRPYEPGEDLSQVSVDVGYTPKSGDMIATDGKTSWLINQTYFDTNYEEAT
jgi:hypothetical protein